MVRHIRRTGRAEQNRIMALDQVAPIFRHERAGLLVALRSPVEMVERNRKSAVAFRARGQRFHARGDDF
jgi:hypothetical protein